MEFTHFDAEGNARMVDVSEKETSGRTAVAQGTIRVSEEVMEAVLGKKKKKGDVFTVAQIAGISGAKRTSDLIPLCHNIALTNAEVTFETDPGLGIITVYCTAKTRSRTGVEMEALTGVCTALLTVYDMCKAIDKRMVIEDIHLLKKTGGKSGEFTF